MGNPLRDIPGYRVYLTAAGKAANLSTTIGEPPTGAVDIPADDAKLDDSTRNRWVVFLRGDREIARFAEKQIVGYVDLSV